MLTFICLLSKQAAGQIVPPLVSLVLSVIGALAYSAKRHMEALPYTIKLKTEDRAEKQLFALGIGT